MSNTIANDVRGRSAANETIDAATQVAQLVRSGEDALRLVIPIRDWAELSNDATLVEELAATLRDWDTPSFEERADRALEIVRSLDDLWTPGNGVDMMDLGERRVVLNALGGAITVQRARVRAA